MAHEPTQFTGPDFCEIHLRILHTSDVHGALRGYDYLADKPSEFLGLARTATLIRAARAVAANSLLFDTGDMLQGSALCDLTANRGLPQGVTHPMVNAMNALGYDGFAPGNHDFNHGIDFLSRALEDADFPVVSSNFLHLNPAGRNTPVFPPHTILSRRLVDQRGQPHDLRIGVTGCLPPQTIDWDHKLAESYTTSDMVAATRTEIADLRTQGCDLIVLLAHTGIDPGHSDAGSENAAIELAGLAGVDIVLAGHTHLTFPAPHGDGPVHPAINNDAGTIHGTPVLMPGFGGNHLGQSDLTLTRNASGNWRVHASHQTLLPLARRSSAGQVSQVVTEDATLCSLSEPAHVRTLNHIREPVGETRNPLHSFFSMIANDASVQLVAQAQAMFLRRAVADTELATLPLLSVAAPFKTGRRGGPDHYTCVPTGPLTRRSVSDLYVYPNTFCAVRLVGAQLREWLEHAASLFTHIPPGTPRDVPLLIDSFPGYKFDVICGLTYEIDLRQPPRYDDHLSVINPATRRIRNLCHKGSPVRDDQIFLVATNAFRVYGVGFPGAPADPDDASAPEIVFESPVSIHDILLDYIRNNSPLDFTSKRVWSFTPLAGATARFQTSPVARDYLNDPHLPKLRDLGDTSDGFAEFRITL
ncbi:bifunctional 2',3'-cyclic-nucleotide 2'-phosphodiesterase/3'-nucleotidase [Alisedimentitalea sp. MJ-SS2]|uniref:bifunctional 2',3'-cyclic-nucleotide 2'-phosphodiesterase/3'-nucleotidase n=1 Tax=Aliisedimentitalea sp. MJ-SS2 TaxID=3049795 RepID=UPI00291579AD|nr:bifunctional 2',3'-cyclic-nucleotide 2'-phosphodiesterase/3'-nucleotidase [Alisedimentitalea sp. MJ-SS2]MDU8928097.1 bifunctional 2',3'-cyclic-nucleotide 2'-phosphodiesterase/3'-nucleotidase [Alisedimentitalea sp. MJ-SS2]